MKILWLCNIILPEVAKKLGITPSNKEGWLSGICSTVSKNRDFELHICFPVDASHDGFKLQSEGINYYGFYEDTAHPENYDEGIEASLLAIVKETKPDVVHIFGTEYPHTLAMCRVLKDTPEKILIGIQGVLEYYKDRYFEGLPEYVVKRVTFRDFLRKDSLRLQQKKYALRAINEVEAVKLAGNITGRTPFDKRFHDEFAPASKYHFMNETLRDEFYEGVWDESGCEKHTIFLSQGNYPIKGAHYLLMAMPEILKAYPDTRVYIAGDNVTKHGSLKEKLKLSSYGKYLLELIKKYGLDDKICFSGSLDAKGIKERLLLSNVFLCPSSIENSPNSLGEAMLLGVPCVTANVGGISGIFDADRDGIMYEATDAKTIAASIAESICRVFSKEAYVAAACENARQHAMKNHNPKANYDRLLEIYREIYGCR